jgi:hypothetical protein
LGDALPRRVRGSARCAFLALALALVAGVAIPAAARGESAPVPPGAPQPGADPTHQTPLELLAGRIASHIAGRAVTVTCYDPDDWRALVTAQGGDPSAESGFVATQWNGSTGALIALAPVAQLADGVCQPLQQFASAATKPTSCLPAGTLVAGVRRAAGARARKAPPPAPVPCYLGAGRAAAPMSPAYWLGYGEVAVAILTLAHESIHLSGIVGGTLANGLAVGDPQAEAKADCYGMQWMPYVAEQLGASPADAQAIARFFWDKVYPVDQTSDPAYWSPQCVPGGALDLHLPGATAWP